MFVHGKWCTGNNQSSTDTDFDERLCFNSRYYFIMWMPNLRRFRNSLHDILQNDLKSDIIALDYLL